MTTASINLRKAENTLAYASFATPHFIHGWALGVVEREKGKDSSSHFMCEFLDGYITGWLEQDELLTKPRN